MAVIGVGLILTACGGEETARPTTGDATVDPAEFVDTIDNPHLPYQPGDTWRYEGRTDEGTEVVTVTVTGEQKRILGVPVVVVRDTVSLGGEVIEDTYDWFAQDRTGNVWYFGEDTREIENGEVLSTEGSWEAGVDGAEAGIVMPADPEPGPPYRQEYYKGEAEDMGQVLAAGVTVRIGLGTFDDVVRTRDWTPLEPDVVEHKFYAPGVGLVLEQQVRGGREQVELVETSRRLSGASADTRQDG
jgi:hypothetical protein